MALKQFLNLKGKPPEPLPQTEDFDAETKQALLSFQKRAGLEADGIVGPKTAGALSKLVGPSAASFAKSFGDGEAENKGPDKGAGKGAKKARASPTKSITTFR